MSKLIPYRPLLAWLTVIFGIRVFLQWIQQFGQIQFLPGFDLWHSNIISYPTLLLLQALILAIMVLGVLTIKYQTSSMALGRVICTLGWVYLSIMVMRLLIGSLELFDHSWFAGAVPTAFHMGLAAYLLVYGASLKEKPVSSQESKLLVIARYSAYPSILMGSYLLFNWLLSTGSPLMFSAYLSVLVGATGIVLHENLAPKREDWRPSRADVISDGQFLVIVQVALPAIMKALTLALILVVSQHGGFFFQSYWPHQESVLLQVVVMVLVAEFFRYWIHRAAHRFIPLWKLHAVHHAADKLYTVNVGRFHPFDKALQFLGDTLLFLLIGVSPEVFATYFVLYALNGFYQHSNADVKLGLLNWVIAGPEVHRWHHSSKFSEANHNFGNNLIVWDTVFGTRFLPEEREVKQVGISNKEWPNSFWPQLKAPFTTPVERVIPEPPITSVNSTSREQ